MKLTAQSLVGKGAWLLTGVWLFGASESSESSIAAEAQFLFRTFGAGSFRKLKFSDVIRRLPELKTNPASAAIANQRQK